MLGLFMAFYWPPREIKAVFEAGANGKTEVTSGGTAAKSRDAFQAEFSTIMTAFRRSK